MTGRGVDQILPHPSDPRLRESCVREATDTPRWRRPPAARSPARWTRLWLAPASGPDRRWLAGTLGRMSRPFGAAVELAPDGLLVLHPPAGRR
jgi:hypothetical protein